MQHRRGHALSKATPSSMSAKLRNNQLSIYSIFYEDLWWKVWMRLFVFREQSGPHKTLKCPIDCPVEGKCSLHLSCVIKLWGSLGPSLWLWAARLWKILQQHRHKRQCSFSLASLSLTEEPRAQVVYPTPQTSMQTKKKNPTSQQSSADSQYKMTTIKHESIHQLLMEIKTNEPANRKILFVLFVLGRVRSSERGHGVMIQRCHKATTVHGCLSLQGSTPLLSW